ncbi:DUF86 domain-containing protein [Thermoanaerobacteraceae bacterium SP2]|nr:DUF86 domain-containing protein [Thermoanaerobacteraceae bacterium SP2]
MIDKNRINAKIIFINERLSALRELASLDENEFKQDKRNIGSACYWLQTTVESMIDIAQHIAVKKGLIKSTDISSADFFEELAAAGIISKENMRKYRMMIKFRNRIVHLYQQVSEDEVIKILKEDLNDFETFLKEIANFIAKKEG